MIISVHIPKAAGNTLGAALTDWYGSRLKRDYGDAAGYDDPEWNDRRNKRMSAARTDPGALMRDFDIIHGHFIADKYHGLFPEEYYTAFFRDPFPQTVSHYHFLKRSENLKNPVVQTVHETGMTLEEFIEWEQVANPQTQFVGNVPIEEFAMVGLTEEFDRSVGLFNAVLACGLPQVKSENVNPDKRVVKDDISDDLTRRIRKYREPDIELYEKVRTQYRSLTFKYDC